VKTLILIEPILTPLLKLAGEEEAFREYFDMAQAFLINAATGRLEDAWRGFIDYRNGRGTGRRFRRRPTSASWLGRTVPWQAFTRT
jgi:hypothetical protein